MGDRIIKTGLSKKYKDMLDAVIGQMSDGYWENSPMMRGYWKFVNTGTSGDEVTLNVDEVSGARDGDRRIDNRFYGMSDDAVKKFFADKIKFLIKEEGLGKWDRGNESETDFLSYDRPRYRVKDCYYAYEILKGRNARKHTEYGDVAETKEGSAKREKGGTKVVSRFTVSNPDLDIDGQTIEEALDKRFPMGDVFVRIIGKTKCEFRIEGEILKAIDIHWIERTIGAIAALEVNCRE